MSHARFVRKKAHILSQLSALSESYQDASPKGSVDEEIVDLIEQVNAVPDLVTTSSCGGRVAVFADGVSLTPGASTVPDAPVASSFLHAPHAPQASRTPGEPGPGGAEASEVVRKKARGGRWLFVSHSPLDLSSEPSRGHDQPKDGFTRLFGMSNSAPAPNIKPTFPTSENMENVRFIHLRFEPMILHVLTSSLKIASTLLTAAQAAGFRESGCTSLTSAMPMVAVRSTALALDCVVGVVSVGFSKQPAGSERPQGMCDTRKEALLPYVSEEYLRMLAEEVNRRFEANAARIERLKNELGKAFSCDQTNDCLKMCQEEDAETRRGRKRQEGLARREQLSRTVKTSFEDTADVLDDGLELV